MNGLEGYTVYNPWENAVSPLVRPIVVVSRPPSPGSNLEVSSPLLLPQSSIEIEGKDKEPYAVTVPIIIEDMNDIEDTNIDHIDQLSSPVTAKAQWHTSMSIATFEENLVQIKQSADEADEPVSNEDASFISNDASSIASFNQEEREEKEKE
ncbi:hypothetical protein BDF19DRAFT_291978 [Syncephalis fuscata]|nr:hypothetical protein BDF19DRAFT_291978 [Syncephalis fuscata]